MIVECGIRLDLFFSDHHQKVGSESYAIYISGSSLRLGDSLEISNRGTKAKTITSYDNALVTNSFRTDKTPSRNGNQPRVMRMRLLF